MKAIRSLLIAIAAVGTLATSQSGAADGNTRAPADTPQDRASDRQKPYKVPSGDQHKRGEAQGGTAGAAEGRIGGTPRTSNPREGEFGSGGAQTGNLGASKGGADNMQSRPHSGAMDRNAAPQPNNKRGAPEHP